MVDVVCPVCGEETTYMADEMTLFNRVECSRCHAILEVVAESPLELEPVDEDFNEEEDDFEDLDDSDEEASE